MERPSGIKWLFLDLNSYFASVEQQEHPHLRGKPVAVVPAPTDTTCAIAASYEAKAYGIKTGTKIYDARRLCPELHCILGRHETYVNYHHRILEEVVKHTPIHKVRSIDELDSRLPPNKRDIERAKDVAMAIKRGLWDSIGTAINCSIGLAPNSLLAKIATNMQKPDGLVIIRQEDLPGPLLNLKLTDIPGIGHNMEKRLHRAGIGSMEQLWNTSPKQLRKIWNSVQGERMWYWLHGYDFPAPETGTVMIGHSRMLDPSLRPPDKARLMARRLLTKACTRLRRKTYYATRLSLSARTIEGLKSSLETTFPALNDPFTALHHLDALWAHMIPALISSSASGRLIKVSVLFHGLKQKHEITEDLFSATHAQHIDTSPKNEALASALDHLRDKYHQDTVSVGLTPKTRSGDVGTKIAFARVPEKEEFWSG